MNQTMRTQMTEQHEWNIEGRDVFIERWSDNGLETITVEEAELRLNEYETLKKATEALNAEDARTATKEIYLTHHGRWKVYDALKAYADILEGKDG